MTGVATIAGADWRVGQSPLFVPAFGYLPAYAQDATIDAPVADWQPPAGLAHLHHPA